MPVPVRHGRRGRRPGRRRGDAGRRRRTGAVRRGDRRPARAGRERCRLVEGAEGRRQRPLRVGDTGPVSFSPGPSPGASGTSEASRNASCRLRRPSRSGAAWWWPSRGAPAVDQAGQRLDQGAGLVEVPVLGQVLGEPEVHRGGAHQVQGGGRDDLEGRHVGDVAGGLGAAGDGRAGSWHQRGTRPLDVRRRAPAR